MSRCRRKDKDVRGKSDRCSYLISTWFTTAILWFQFNSYPFVTFHKGALLWCADSYQIRAKRTMSVFHWSECRSARSQDDAVMKCLHPSDSIAESSFVQLAYVRSSACSFFIQLAIVSSIHFSKFTFCLSISRWSSCYLLCSACCWLLCLWQALILLAVCSSLNALLPASLVRMSTFHTSLSLKDQHVQRPCMCHRPEHFA